MAIKLTERKIDVKGILKSLKLNESTLSMLIGAVVIILVGIVAINYFAKNRTGEVVPPIDIVEENKFPTNHLVAADENLWTISENYYGTGYNWVDIAEVNNLDNPDAIVEGMTITIPNVEPKLAGQRPSIAVSPTGAEATITETETPTTIASTTATPVLTLSPTPKPDVASGDLQDATEYTVQKGDNLWKIAVAAYGDGYKWTEISKMNELVNPGIIHAGNVLKLPR